MWQSAESHVFRQLNFSNIRREKIIEALLQRFEDKVLPSKFDVTEIPITIASLQRGGCVRRSKAAHKHGFTALNWPDACCWKATLSFDWWFMVPLQILKIRNFCWRFSCHHHFRHRYQSGPDFSEMNNDADLIFITVWQQVIRFSNMANLFGLDGGPYSYLDFKKLSLSKF